MGRIVVSLPRFSTLTRDMGVPSSNIVANVSRLPRNYITLSQGNDSPCRPLYLGLGLQSRTSPIKARINGHHRPTSRNHRASAWRDGCASAGSARLETFDGATVWEGIVHVFDLAGHPKASRAYAWSSPIEGSTKRRFFAVLHTDKINSPVAAVRAAIVAEHRTKGGTT